MSEVGPTETKITDSVRTSGLLQNTWVETDRLVFVEPPRCKTSSVGRKLEFVAWRFPKPSMFDLGIVLPPNDLARAQDWLS